MSEILFQDGWSSSRDNKPMVAVVLRSLSRIAGPMGAQFTVVTLASALLLLGMAPAPAQDQPPLEPARSIDVVETIRTDSPRETLDTFRLLTDRMEIELLDYLSAPSLAGQAEIALLSDQLRSLLDLTDVPAAARRQTGLRTYTILMDIFGRVGLPDAAD